MQLNSKPELQVKIKNSSKTFYEGPAYSVSSYNNIGIFDILPEHANFISIIKNKIIVDRGRTSEKEIPVDIGVLSIKGNKINIYMGFSSDQPEQKSPSLKK